MGLKWVLRPNIYIEKFYTIHEIYKKVLFVEKMSSYLNKLNIKFEKNTKNF